MNKPIILIVEDDSVCLNILGEILKDNFDLKVAKSGKVALEIIEKYQLDLIVLDNQLPDIEGIELCNNLKNLGKIIHTPVILITANDNKDLIVKAYEAGVADYVKKPIFKPEITARINNHLNLEKERISLEEKIEKEIEKRVSIEKDLVQQAKMAEMGNMMDNIIHQWKQPLSLIAVLASAHTFAIKNNIDSFDDIESDLQEIINQIDFMEKTSCDFRDFFSSKKQKTTFLVENVLKSIENILNHRIRDCSVSIEKNYTKGLNSFGFENELAQVILSILNNALDKFKSKANNKLFISTSLNNDIISIKIADNAGEIPNELLPKKLFKRELTTKENGTGLGLSIAQEIIVNNFNGALKAYNENGNATFEIKIRTTP